MRIREIKIEDNLQIESVIKSTFKELGLPLEGTAYEDIETTRMFESYHEEKAIYFVIEENGQVKGCLLYTSPSPRDRTRSRMPSSA